jgi:hypothetical protein
MDLHIQQGKIIQRYHQILNWIFVGFFVIFFFSGQLVMVWNIGSFTVQNWWVPGGIELVGFLIIAIPSILGLYLRYTKGEVIFERDAEKQTVRMNNERLAGEWFIWREGASISDRYVSVVLLLLGVLILLMSLMTWMKTNQVHGNFHFSQRAMMIPQLLIGTTILWTGIVFWFNRIYTYRLFLRQGRKRITLGIRMPIK